MSESKPGGMQSGRDHVDAMKASFRGLMVGNIFSCV